MNAQPEQLIFLDAHEPTLNAGTYDITVEQSLRDTPAPGSGRDSRALPTLSRSARFHVAGPRVALQPDWVESRFPPASSAGDHADVLPHVVFTRSALPWERKPSESKAEHAPWLAVLLFEEGELATRGENGTPLAEHPVPVEALRLPSNSPAFPGLGVDRGLANDDVVSVLDVPRSVLEPVMPDSAWLRYLAHVRARSLATVGGADADQLAAHLDAPNRDTANRVAVAAKLIEANIHLSRQARIMVDVRGAEWRIEDPATDRFYYVTRADPTADLHVTDNARAVVMSCRLTRSGGRYRAFLVSIEDRFDDTSGAFDYGGSTAATDRVRLIVLDRWAFSVAEDAGHLEALLKGLAVKEWTDTETEFKPLHLAIPTQELDDDGNVTRERTGAGVPMLQSGFAPLFHRLRNGGQTWSWYRGPLVRRIDPWTQPESVVHGSDQLLVRDVESGLLDTSYAAAWELGRHLTLANAKVALEIVRWKTDSQHAEHRSSDEQLAAEAHLRKLPAAGRAAPVPPNAGMAVPLPPTVLAWLEQLALLEGVPFGYLVPDPSMLPPESLRVFRVDPQWQTCLIDGALSAGRVLGATAEEERTWERDAREAVIAGLGGVGAAHLSISGCLIRSEVVSGWPGLIVDGRSAIVPPPPPNSGPEMTAPVLRILRRAKLSDNVVLVFYDDVLEWIDLHPSAEALHHGVELDDTTGERRSAARVINGKPVGGRKQQMVNARPDILDIGHASVDDSGVRLTVEALAVELIAGVPRVHVRVPW